MASPLLRACSRFLLCFDRSSDKSRQAQESAMEAETDESPSSQEVRIDSLEPSSFSLPPVPIRAPNPQTPVNRSRSKRNFPSAARSCPSSGSTPEKRGRRRACNQDFIIYEDETAMPLFDVMESLEPVDEEALKEFKATLAANSADSPEADQNLMSASSSSATTAFDVLEDPTEAETEIEDFEEDVMMEASDDGDVFLSPRTRKPAVQTSSEPLISAAELTPRELARRLRKLEAEMGFTPSPMSRAEEEDTSQRAPQRTPPENFVRYEDPLRSPIYASRYSRPSFSRDTSDDFLNFANRSPLQRSQFHRLPSHPRSRSSLVPEESAQPLQLRGPSQPPEPVNEKKRKRIAPTLITSTIDPDRDRQIPTHADSVIANHPDNVEEQERERRKPRLSKMLRNMPGTYIYDFMRKKTAKGTKAE